MVINRRHFELIDIDQIAHASEYDYVGFRVMYKDKESYKIGDTPNRSRVWIDGEPTEEYLRGACAVSSEMIASTYDGYEGYLGDTILVLGSNNAEGGNDPGEIIMIDAVVLDIIDAEKLMTR
jgi:hypothetical protein